MLTNEPTLRPGLFRLPDEPVASMVLIPGFRAAKRVRGAFGWFTAGWIGRLAPGLAEYINHETTAPIDFTVAPALFPEERSAVEFGAMMTAQEAAEPDRRCVRRRAGRSVDLGSSRPGLPRVDDCHGPTAAADRSSHTRIELSSENLAFRGWRESCPRAGFRQCNASRGGGRRRAHRRRRFMVAGEPGPRVTDGVAMLDRLVARDPVSESRR